MPYLTQTDRLPHWWIHLYILYSPKTGLYKIGVSQDVEKRIKSLKQPSNRTIGVRDEFIMKLASWHICDKSFGFHMERHLHVRLEKRRIRGEWFSMTDVEIKQLIEYITRILERAQDIPISETHRFGWSCDAIALFPVDYHVLELCRMFKGWGRPEI